MIRFSAFLVVVAVGLLVAGVVTSKLLLVYLAIGVSGVALLALGIGAAVNWRELTGKPKTAQPKTVETSAQGPASAPQIAVPHVAVPATATSQPAESPAWPSQVPVPAPAPASTAHAQPGLQGYRRSAPSPAAAGSAHGPSRAGYLPTTEPPPRARPAAAGTPAATRGSGPAAPGGSPETRPSAQQPGPRPADVPRAPAAFTPRRETPAPGVWEWRDDTVQAAAAAQAPAPPRTEDTAVPPSTAQRDQSPDAPPPTVQIPAREPPPADAQDEAKPAAASKPEPASEPEPAPESEPARDPAPVADVVSEAVPVSEPELTLVPGAAPAAASSHGDQAEQDKQDKQPDDAEPAGPDPTMEVTVVPGVPRYHNANCILIRFMGDSDLDKMTLAAARKAGCTPCRACLPDQPDKSPE